MAPMKMPLSLIQVGNITGRTPRKKGKEPGFWADPVPN